MSYDMDIGTESYNYTYNVSDMWYKASPEKGIRVIYGLSGEDAAVELQNMLNFMIEDYEEMIKMEPSNGWGDYKGAMNFIIDLIIASNRNKEETWRGD